MRRTKRRRLDLASYTEAAGSNIDDLLDAKATAAAAAQAPAPSTEAQVEQSGAGQAAEGFSEIEIHLIKESPYQARTEFDRAEIRAHAEDIRASGLNNPITVRPRSDGSYELVAGERRLRAVRELGHATVLARIRRITDFEAHLIGVSENRRRADLSPWEKAQEMAALQRHAREDGRPHTVRDLGSMTQTPIGTVSEQLQVAEALPATAVAEAGIRLEDVCRLPHTALNRIAKLSDSERMDALRSAALRIRGEKDPKKAEGKKPKSEDRWARYWSHGGFQVNIRRPISELTGERATAYLESMVAGISALTARVKEGEEPAPVRIRGEHGEMLYLPPLASIGDETRAELLSMLDDLLTELRTSD
jgi:ParB-like chromosome segregation protein Spo0J